MITADYLRMIIILLTMSITFQMLAQEDRLSTDSISDVVSQTVWKAFKRAYESKDAEAFNALHTKDVMRVSPWGIKIGQEYFDSNTKHFSEKPERSQHIDFAMEHRVYSNDHGYEVGFYRIIYTVGEEEVHRSYARFHVRLSKVQGRWKIAQDWDVHQINGEDFTEDDFQAAELLEL